MTVLSKQEVHRIVKEALKKIGHLPKDESFDAGLLDETHKSQLVNKILSEFKKSGANTIISEPELDNFHSVKDIVDWCYENQEG